jgi:SAM-dependent methyltransferase
VAQLITRRFLEDLLGVVEAADPVVEFGALQVEADQDSDLRRLFPGRPYTGTDMRPGPGVDRVEDLCHLTFADGSVGTALSFDTLEHCADPPQACRELTRVTADGGLCVISSVMLFGIHAYPNDYFRFTPEGFRSLLSGFDDVRVVGVGDPGIPMQVFGVASKGRTLGTLDLATLPIIVQAQRRWDDPAHGLKIGPYRIPPRELAGTLRHEVPKLVRARLARRRTAAGR